MRKRIAFCGLLGLALPGSLAYSQNVPAPPANQAPAQGFVTREEYDKLQQKMDTVIKQMAEMKQ